jgi:hypothetical protein
MPVRWGARQSGSKSLSPLFNWDPVVALGRTNLVPSYLRGSV